MLVFGDISKNTSDDLKALNKTMTQVLSNCLDVDIKNKFQTQFKSVISELGELRVKVGMIYSIFNSNLILMIFFVHHILKQIYYNKQYDKYVLITFVRTSTKCFCDVLHRYFWVNVNVIIIHF